MVSLILLALRAMPFRSMKILLLYFSRFNFLAFRFGRIVSKLPTLAHCSSVMCSLNADSRILEHEFQFDSVFRRLPPLASKFRGLAAVTLQQLRGRCLYNLVLVARHSPTGHQVAISKFIWKFQASYPFVLSLS